MVFYSQKLVYFVKNRIRGIFLCSDRTGENVLTRACKRFRLRFIKFLAFLGINLDTKNKKGETPLWAALNSRNKNKNDELVKLLVNYNVGLDNGYGGDTPLTFAIKKNDVNLVNILLENIKSKANVNLKNAFGEVPLILACEIDNLELVRLLIKEDADVNCKNIRGETPLWIACRNDNNELAKLLIDKNADVNFKFGNMTLLKIACKRNNYYLSKLLLENNITSDRSLWTVLDSKIENKNELIDLLLKHNININECYFGEIPLTFAVRKNDMNLVKILVSNKVNSLDINNKNSYDESALWIAIYNNNKDIIKYLIDNGANLDYTNLSKDTPLIYAIKENDMELFNMLFQHESNKADANKENWKSPLWWCISKNRKDMIKVLIMNKADVDKEYGGKTPLMIACKNGDMELVKLLLLNEFNRADVNHKNIFEETALWQALNAKKYNIVKFLIQHGANINKQDISGSTPLLVASKDGNIELVDFFIKNKADLNLENDNEETPLILACASEQIDIAAMLIRNNADVNKKDGLGRSALTIACKNNNERLLKLLVHKVDLVGKTPLINACEKGDLKLIKLFVENGADINVNVSGKTPLLIVLRLIRQNKYSSDFIIRYYEKIAKYLIDKGADVNASYGNSTPLLEAIPYDTEISKYIIDKGADINFVCYTKTPLLEAIIYNSDIAKYLIDKGADVNKGVYDKFPLFEAIMYDKEIAKYLIENKANVNIVNLKKQTPLAVIVDKYVEESIFTNEERDMELAKLLIANGANIDVLYKNLEKKGKRRFIKLLLEDEVTKTIIAIRNKEILKNKEVAKLLDKEKAGVVTKVNLEMASIIFRKKKVEGNFFSID